MARGVSLRTGIAWGLALALFLSVGAVSADTDPRVTDIVPELRGDLLVCAVATEGLPGNRILSTLNSGLDSAVEIRLELTSERGHAQVRSYDIQLSFDLWEEVYTVYIGPQVQRFMDIDGLRGFLSELPPLAVAPLADLETGSPYRITAGLKLHTLAPDARGRMEEMVSGSHSADRSTGDSGQEVSVSLGRLIRFFYRGGSPRGDLVGSFQSRPFTARELINESH